MAVVLALTLATAVAGPASGRPRGDAERGAVVFARRCTLCHSGAPGGRIGVGPPLWGVAGRLAASSPGYPYSETLRLTRWTWNDERLDRYLKSPSKAVRGTKMNMYLPERNQRRDVIVYLHRLR